MPYQSNVSLDESARIIAARATGPDAGPIRVLAHAKPDGDAFGSVLALTLALRRLGATVTGVLGPPVPGYLHHLPAADTLVTDHPGLALPDPALVVVCDTGARSQLGDTLRHVETHLDRTLVLDHHLSGDLPARWLHIDPTRASACELVADVIQRLPHAESDPSAASDVGHPSAIDTALFTGVATDTGWFKFSNTTPATLRLAADLLERGVDHTRLYALLEQSDPPEKLALTARALGSLRFVADGRGVVMTLTKQDFADTGTTISDTERLVDLPQRVAQVEAVALVTEREGPDGTTVCRISFRSKPLPNAVDVSALANTFGGGGHARASGGGYNGDATHATDAVAQALERALEQAITSGHA